MSACLTPVALALRLATLDPHGPAAAPAIAVETDCGLEAGVAFRHGAPVPTFAVRRRFPGFWVRLGAEWTLRERRTLSRPVTYYRRPATGIGLGLYSREPVDPVETVTRDRVVHARLSLGRDLALGRGFALAIELEPLRPRVGFALRKALR